MYERAESGGPVADTAMNVSKQQAQSLMMRDANPTLASNIDQKIAWHQDEIVRLNKIKEQFPPAMLAMNIRDLREAMQY